ncbi:MAG: DUF2461 domain-containing protein [Sulfurimonas sp.]|nr:DUF2461 domain-containing protein [Sulfurimonas sp.]
MGFVFYDKSQYRDIKPNNMGFTISDEHWIEKPMLDAYREYIKDEKRRQNLAITLDKLLKYDYKTIEKGYKRFPRGFNADMPNAELSLYKGMAVYAMLDPNLITDGDKLISTLYDIYEKMLPLQQIMYEVSLRAKENGK